MNEQQEPKAFPAPCASLSGPIWDKGMDLRDWFAGEVVSGMYASDSVSIKESAEEAGLNVQDFIANIAYFQADAMLRARQQPQG